MSSSLAHLKTKEFGSECKKHALKKKKALVNLQIYSVILESSYILPIISGYLAAASSRAG